MKAITVLAMFQVVVIGAACVLATEGEHTKMGNGIIIQQGYSEAFAMCGKAETDFTGDLVINEYIAFTVYANVGAHQNDPGYHALQTLAKLTCD